MSLNFGKVIIIFYSVWVNDVIVENKVVMVEMLEVMLVFVLNYDGYMLDSILVLFIDRLGVKYVIFFIEFYNK